MLRQALHVCDASSSQEERTTERDEEFQEILANTPPADLIKEGNIETKRDSKNITDITDLDVEQQPSPLPSIAAISDAGISRKMHDLGAIPGLKIISPQEDINKTDTSHHPHTALPGAWLYGKTNLEHTGRCIRAELEVAMLCMQKRLEQVRYVRHLPYIFCTFRVRNTVAYFVYTFPPNRCKLT